MVPCDMYCILVATRLLLLDKPILATTAFEADVERSVPNTILRSNDPFYKQKLKVQIRQRLKSIEQRCSADVTIYVRRSLRHGRQENVPSINCFWSSKWCVSIFEVTLRRSSRLLLRMHFKILQNTFIDDFFAPEVCVSRSLANCDKYKARLCAHNIFAVGISPY